MVPSPDEVGCQVKEISTLELQCSDDVEMWSSRACVVMPMCSLHDPPKADEGEGITPASRRTKDECRRAHRDEDENM